jgi:phenylacetate-CoA ligase
MSALFRALETAPRYAALLRSQYWKPEQLRAYTEYQLERILKAAAKIPFYTDRFNGVARPQDLEALPLLKRADISALNRSVRSMYPAGRHFFAGASSGSTGMQAQFLFDRSRLRGRYAARLRFLRSHGWGPLRRTVWHRTAPFPGEQDADFLHHRILPGFMALSTDLAAQVEQLVDIDPVYLYMFPSNLEGMLSVLEHRHLRLRSLRRIFTVSETLEDWLRQRARRILGVEIADQYGATEASIAWQCPHGSYHANAEHVLLEVIDDAGRPVTPGEVGRVVITTLENYLMPLVRYEIGDYAITATGACPCGRTLPLLGRVVGRKFSLFRTSDGRLFSATLLTELIRACPGMGQFQLLQRTAESYVVRYVASQPVSTDTESRISREFDAFLGAPVHVTFERVAEIARTKGGKYMIAISDLAAN